MICFMTITEMECMLMMAIYALHLDRTDENIVGFMQPCQGHG